MPAQETPPTEQRSHLSDLVRERRQALGLSLQAFAERAVDPETGTKLKYGWIHRLEKNDPNEQVIPPRLPQLKALAAAAQVPLEVIQDAAGQQFFGIDPVRSTSGTARALIKRADRLSPEEYQQVVNLMDLILRDSEE